MERHIIKYNPAFLNDEELLRTFAVRHTDFDIIMRIMRENMTNVNQHIMVIGPRGSGKTLLLLRVGLEVRTDENLKNMWYPLVYAEESYSICSVGEFWLEALFHVANQTGDKKWQGIIDELNDEKDDKRLAEMALAKLLDFADSIKRRLLLIVENFNMLFDGQVSDQDAWALRHTLINEPRIMLLTSATSRMDQLENSGSAMYELFKQHDLKPLDKEECRTVWESITNNHLSDDRIRPIQILTGGNPRLLSIISSFGSKLSFNDLMSDLLNLVDDNTEYFKSHLDNLPAIERKAYLALAELWDPAPAKSIARLARLDVSKTSSLMARLVSRGAVKVSDESKRTKLYQTTERMYNIYYLMRKRGAPSERVKAVVNFMVSFYAHDELMHVTKTIAEEACGLAPESCQDHFLSYEAILSNLQTNDIKQKIIDSTPKRFLDLCNEYCSSHDLPLIQNNGNSKSDKDKMRSHRRAVRYDRKNIESVKAYLLNNPNNCEALNDYAKLLNENNSNVEAEEIYRKLISVNPKCPKAMGSLGLLLHFKLKRYDEAEELYKRQLETHPKDYYIWGSYGKLLHENLKRFDEAERAYRKAISIKKSKISDKHWIWEQLGQLLDEKLNRNQEAEYAYKKSIEYASDCSRVWSLLAILLHHKLSKYEEAEQAYNKVIERDPKDYWATECLGTLLHYKLNRYADAESVYNKAIKIKPRNHTVWSNLGLLLHQKLKRYEEAERMYKKALSLKPNDATAQTELMELILKRRGQIEKGFKMAEYYINKNSRSASTYNTMAWAFYKYGAGKYLSDAEAWAKEAISIKPDDAHYYHTYACILAVLNRGNEALQLAQKYIQEINLATKRIDDTIELFVVLTAVGYGKQALDMLVKSPIAEKLEPLIVGIKLYLGEEMQIATEILEVAKDVRQRIQTTREKIEEESSDRVDGKVM